MSYVSVTCPGVARGPHEHREQTDCLGLVGPSTFRIFLWDNRKSSATFGRRLVLELGSADPGLLVIPPGVVHAYLNIGDCDGVVVNCPDRLYAGAGRSGPVDEIRHEHDPDSRFRMTADD
jgi:dTDP-4-dehydrorhamnose 3,5-epimerase